MRKQYKQNYGDRDKSLFGTTLLTAECIRERDLWGSS